LACSRGHQQQKQGTPSLVRAAGRFDSRPCMMVLPDEFVTRQSHPRPRFESTMSNIEYLSCHRPEKFIYSWIFFKSGHCDFQTRPLGSKQADAQTHDGSDR
jgi:hypothetical protein